MGLGMALDGRRNGLIWGMCLSSTRVTTLLWEFRTRSSASSSADPCSLHSNNSVIFSSTALSFGFLFGFLTVDASHSTACPNICPHLTFPRSIMNIRTSSDAKSTKTLTPFPQRTMWQASHPVSSMPGMTFLLLQVLLGEIVFMKYVVSMCHYEIQFALWRHPTV